MLKCKECEFYSRDETTGQVMLKCDPFDTVKEPECLAKMQLMRLEAMMQMQHATMRWQQRMTPMQEKMFKFC